MPRTTIDIDATVLRKLKERQQREGKTLGQLASELLATALRGDSGRDVRAFAWKAGPLGARVDLDDKEALRRTLEGR
jgi:hypothetical protein